MSLILYPPLQTANFILLTQFKNIVFNLHAFLHHLIMLFLHNLI